MSDILYTQSGDRVNPPMKTMGFCLRDLCEEIEHLISYLQLAGSKASLGNDSLSVYHICFRVIKCIANIGLISIYNTK